MKVLEILNEKLEDMPVGNILTHKTNIEAFERILEDGTIDGNRYTISSGSTPNKMLVLKNKEIATSRNSGKISEKELSSNIGKITFFIYKNRLQGSHLFRKGNIKTIAELPMESYRRIANDLTNIFGRISNKDKKDIIFELLKRDFSYDCKSVFQDAVFVAIEKKISKSDIPIDVLRNIISEIGEFHRASKSEKKESEERIIIDKLPLDKRIMSIRFEPGALKELNFSSGLHENDYKNLLKNIKKYDELIQNTPEKTAIIKYLENI